MAQLVSRRQLEALAKTSRRVAESNGVFSYSDFKKQHAECIQDGIKMEKALKLEDYEDRFSFAYDKIKQTYLESKCPPIKFAGRGSSRAAFALEGGKCLKIACSKAGTAQNAVELKNVVDAENNWRCFAAIYEHDEEKNASLLTECCAMPKRQDFINMFNLQLSELTDVLNAIVNGFGDFDAVAADLEDGLKNARAYEIQNCKQKLDFLEKLRNPKTVQVEVLADLLNFYEEHAWNENVLLLDDLKYEQNWGLVVRDGQICLVVIDAGFSAEIGCKYYSFA